MSTVKLPRVTGLRLEVLPDASHTNGKYSRGKSGEFLLTDVKVQVRRTGSSQIRDILVKSAVSDFTADKKKNGNYGDIKDTLDDDPRNGWTTKGETATQQHVAVFALDEPLALEPDERLVVELRHRSTLGDQNIGKLRLLATDAAGETVTSVKASPLEDLAAAKVADVASMDAKLRGRLFEQFLEDHAPYQKPRELLQRAKRMDGEALTKSGIMVGLGETREQVMQVMDDMRSANIDFITIGQYLQPTRKHAAIDRFVTPEEFKAYEAIARAKGFLMVSSSPLTRSSHHAGDDFARLRAARLAQTGR